LLLFDPRRVKAKVIAFRNVQIPLLILVEQMQQVDVVLIT